MSAGRWIAIIILVIAGLYLVIWHGPPLPGNHEAVGLGEFHVAHTVVGVILLAAAGYLWYSGRRKATAQPSAA